MVPIVRWLGYLCGTIALNIHIYRVYCFCYSSEYYLKRDVCIIGRAYGPGRGRPRDCGRGLLLG